MRGIMQRSLVGCYALTYYRELSSITRLLVQPAQRSVLSRVRRGTTKLHPCWFDVATSRTSILRAPHFFF